MRRGGYLVRPLKQGRVEVPAARRCNRQDTRPRESQRARESTRPVHSRILLNFLSFCLDR
jgi:hypothetical protein